MTVDVRPAAGREAERHFSGSSDAQARKRKAFIHGAAWATERFAPTREELAAVILEGFHPPDEQHPSWWINPEEAADAVLALFKQRGESA